MQVEPYINAARITISEQDLLAVLGLEGGSISYIGNSDEAIDTIVLLVSGHESLPKTQSGMVLLTIRYKLTQHMTFLPI
jgi:hypothetical protein